MSRVQRGVKSGPRRNYFAVLEELDRPSIVFAPSILAGFGVPSVTSSGEEASSVPAREAGSLFRPSAPKDTVELTSLASLADEISGNVNALSGSWDFSALGGSGPVSDASEKRLLDELDNSHRAFDLHLSKVAEKDLATIGEKLARADLSRKQRIRRMQGAARGEAFGIRLSGKVAKQEQARKRRNQAKSGR